MAGRFGKRGNHHGTLVDRYVAAAQPLLVAATDRLRHAARPRARSRIALSGLRLTPRRRLLARVVDHVAGVETHVPALRVLALFMEVAPAV